MSANFEIIPLVSVGKIKFGTDRADVRNSLGDWREFKKNKFSKNTADDFGSCHVFYNAENKCVAVEFFRGNAALILNGQALFSLDYDGIKSTIKAAHNNIEADENGFTSAALQLGVYAPSENVEAILVADKGYYS